MPLKLRHLKANTYPERNWKNGRGITEEIAVDGDDPFRWRVTLAHLVVGPFSEYPGYERILTLVEGEQTTLLHEGKKEIGLNRMKPHRFSGEWKTEVTESSTGEMRDLNVWALKKKAKAGVYPTFISPREEVQFPIQGQEHFIFCVRGEIAILESNLNQRYVLAQQDTLWVSRDDENEYLNLRAEAINAPAECLWVVIRAS